MYIILPSFSPVFGSESCSTHLKKMPSDIIYESEKKIMSQNVTKKLTDLTLRVIDIDLIIINSYFHEKLLPLMSHSKQVYTHARIDTISIS